MGAQEWTTAAQRDYLTQMLPLFLVALSKPGNKAQQRFWATLSEGWFDLFPEPLSPNLSVAEVAATLERRKNQLRTWMRYRKSPRGVAAAAHARKKTDALFKAFRQKKGTRPYRLIEVYQKMHGPKVRQESLRRGYGLLTDEAEADLRGAAPAPDARVLSAEETKEAELLEEEESLARALHNRRERMKIQRAAATALLDGETDAVKQEGLLRIDVQDSEDEEEPSAGPSTKPAKRIRKKKPVKSAATVPTLDIPVPTAQVFTAPLVPAPATDVSGSEPATTDLPGLPGFDMAISEINSDIGGGSTFGLELSPQMFTPAEEAPLFLQPAPSMDSFSASTFASAPTFNFGETHQERPAPRVMHAGASFVFDREIGDNFGRQPSLRNSPRLTLPPAGVNLYSPPQPPPHRLGWTPSSFPAPSGLFDAFRPPRPTAESGSTASSAHGYGDHGYFPPSVNAPSPSSGASTPTSKIAAPATLALFRSVVTNVSPTSAPSVGPGYIESRPMAHPPKAKPPPRKPRDGGVSAPQSENEEPAGSASARRKPGRPRKTAPSADTSTPALTTTEAPAPQLESEEPAGSAVPKRNPGRPRKTAIEGPEAPRPPPQDVVATPTPAPALTGAAARAESARIRREATQLRSTTTEMLTRSKAIDAEKEKVEAGKRRLAELRCNPTGGADLVVVTRSRSALGKDADSSSVIRPVRKTRGEMTGSILAKAVDPNVVQEAQDAELLARLRKRKSPAPQTGPRRKVVSCGAHKKETRSRIEHTTTYSRKAYNGGDPTRPNLTLRVSCQIVGFGETVTRDSKLTNTLQKIEINQQATENRKQGGKVRESGRAAAGKGEARRGRRRARSQVPARIEGCKGSRRGAGKAGKRERGIRVTG
ncbi:hypothetical protein K438DRAFT_1789824 [Mycena galopus ATCC 62051]|nr:hypothetical protein K438DRAFT_1789824 [Mycena galopus ATCC 62051]